MENCTSYEKWIIWSSFFIALLLEAIPYPYEILIFKPNWVFLVLFYWVLVLSHHLNVKASFVASIMLDLINGSTLGVQALALSAASYFISLIYNLFRNLMLLQQTIVIILLSLLMDFIVFLVEFLVIDASFRLEILWNSIINGMLWPWLFFLMHKIYQKFIFCRKFTL